MHWPLDRSKPKEWKDNRSQAPSQSSSIQETLCSSLMQFNPNSSPLGCIKNLFVRVEPTSKSDTFIVTVGNKFSGAGAAYQNLWQLKKRFVQFVDLDKKIHHDFARLSTIVDKHKCMAETLQLFLQGVISRLMRASTSTSTETPRMSIDHLCRFLSMDVYDPDTISPDVPRMEGYFYKIGRRTGTFVRRFYVLYDDRLDCYLKSDKKKMKRRIPLSKFFAVPLKQSRINDPQHHAMELKIDENGSDHLYILYQPVDETLTPWLDALERIKQKRLRLIIMACISYLEQNDRLKSQGIYRQDGSQAEVNKLERMLHSSPYILEKTQTPFDEHTVACVLKRCLREIFQHQNSMEPKEEMSAEDLKQYMKDQNGVGQVDDFDKTLSLLSSKDAETLKAVMRHLKHVVKFEPYNLMSAQAVSSVFSPTLAVGMDTLKAYLEKE